MLKKTIRKDRAKGGKCEMGHVKVTSAQHTVHQPNRGRTLWGQMRLLFQILHTN